MIEPGNFGPEKERETIDAKEEAVAPSRPHDSTNNSSHLFDADFSKTAKISEIEQCMKDNLAFIQEKTIDCQKLHDEIRKKIEENDRLGNEVIEFVALEEARMGVLEKKMKEVQLEVVKIRDENRSLAEEFGEAWEHMFHVRGKLEKFRSAC